MSACDCGTYMLDHCVEGVVAALGRIGIGEEGLQRERLGTVDVMLQLVAIVVHAPQGHA